MTEDNKIGSVFRIRLPNDYTLKDYDKDILQEASKRYADVTAYELMAQKEHFADMLLTFGYRPPTKWQKFKRRMQDLKQRYKDIWTIVSGGDVHENCDY